MSLLSSKLLTGNYHFCLNGGLIFTKDKLNLTISSWKPGKRPGVDSPGAGDYSETPDPIKTRATTKMFQVTRNVLSNDTVYRGL